jgi:branched-chain amino acid transport system ATP-binding protein
MPISESDAARERAVLVATGLTAGYGGRIVIDSVDAHVAPSEVVAVLGANGSGKTTLINTICGVVRRTRGEVWFQGIRVDRLPAHKVVAAGIAQVPNARRLFGSSTVLENLRLGGYLRRDRQQLEHDVHAFIERWPILEPLAHRVTSTLSGGEQQVVAIGRALMSQPKLLVLDEPSLGLSPKLLDQLYDMIQTLRVETGLPMLVIEQNARKALQIADRIYVMQSGSVIHEGPAQGLTPHDVADIYFAADTTSRQGRDR